MKSWKWYRKLTRNPDLQNQVTICLARYFVIMISDLIELLTLESDIENNRRTIRQRILQTARQLISLSTGENFLFCERKNPFFSYERFDTSRESRACSCTLLGTFRKYSDVKMTSTIELDLTWSHNVFLNNNKIYVMMSLQSIRSVKCNDPLLISCLLSKRIWIRWIHWIQKKYPNCCGDKSGFNIMIAITYGLIIINWSGLRFYDQDYGLIIHYHYT